jgi:hypothetical protein
MFHTFKFLILRSGGTDAAVPEPFQVFCCVFHSIPSFLGCQYLGQKVSHNVPAVYDVLPARIRTLRSKGQGWQNVPQ